MGSRFPALHATSLHNIPLHNTAQLNTPRLNTTQQQFTDTTLRGTTRHNAPLHDKPTTTNMKTITRQEAAAARMRSVTVDIDTANEEHIIDSIESAMRGINAAWVQTGKWTVQLFRVRAELNPFQK